MTDKQAIGGGALTGVTGYLTPPDSDEAFVPGELREVADAGHQSDVTAAQGRMAPSQQGEVGDPEALPEGGPTNLATRDSGYGAEQGLSSEDPAYRMERNPSASEVADEPARQSTPRSGGDTRSDHEEHF